MKNAFSYFHFKFPKCNSTRVMVAFSVMNIISIFANSPYSDLQANLSLPSTLNLVKLLFFLLFFFLLLGMRHISLQFVLDISRRPVCLGDSA